MISQEINSIQMDVFGPRYVGYDFSTTKLDPELKNPMKAWLAQPTAFCIISGGYGCGKTALGASLVPYLLRKARDKVSGLRRSVRFTREDQFYGKLKSNMGMTGNMDLAMKTLADDHLLYYDDLGSVAPKAEEEEGNWRRDMVYSLVDFRYSLHSNIPGDSPYSTIITTNMTKDDLKRIYGPRIASRLLAKENTWIDVQHLTDLREDGF